MLHQYGAYGLLLLLLAGHFLCDYPLQGEFIAMQKNPWLDPTKRFAPWYQTMTAHCAIHAGMVLLLTGSLLLALFEFVIHFLTDTVKCKGKINYNEDQAIHIVCKVWWLLILLSWAH